MTLIQVQGELKSFNIREGGISIPNSDSSLSNKEKPLRLAIIVPYRDRETNLHLFLFFMHQLLSKQNVYYGIYLVEPLENLKFNRAMLINIGFVESNKDKTKNFNCYIFHDVDMLPENQKNIYECDFKFPKQMAIAVNINSYS
jgi:hypothetical protein